MSDPEWATAAREAGWLPPDEIKMKTWRAANLNGERCRWCRAVRAKYHGGIEGWWRRGGSEPQPHRTHCQFYTGPVEHGFANGHMGSFGYWISCTCGADYPEYDADGNKNECPDLALTEREPRVPDLTAVTVLITGNA